MSLDELELSVVFNDGEDANEDTSDEEEEGGVDIIGIHLFSLFANVESTIKTTFYLLVA